MRSHVVPETAVRVYRRYVMVCTRSQQCRVITQLQFNRAAMEDYIEYLNQIKRFDDAAVHLVDIINDERFTSTKNKSKHQLWMELSELIRKHADDIKSVNVGHPKPCRHCSLHTGRRHFAQRHSQVHGHGGPALELAGGLLHPPR